MGWFSYYRQIKHYGGWDKVPDEIKRGLAKTECDPPRALEIAEEKLKAEAKAA